MNIVKLTKADYDEWLKVLNTTFSNPQREMHFEEELPKMCIEDDYHMGQHLAVKEDGKICAVVGIYPLKTIIGGKELTISTVGNMATLPEHEGRGFMTALYKAAMEELKKSGADASRLGGRRQRYSRFGYEIAGYEYNFIICDYTTKSYPDFEKVQFKLVEATDHKELEFINNIRKTLSFHVERSTDNTYSGDYLTMQAWKNLSYVALDTNGNMIGYICAPEDKTYISEVVGKDLQSLKSIVFSWQKEQKADINFRLMPSEVEAVKYFSEVSEQMTLSSPSRFKIINFDKLSDALLKLKATYTPFRNGQKVIGIEDWGNLKICVDNDNVYCEKTEETADIVLDNLSATRLLFGPFAPETTIQPDAFLSSVLPLPLSWNTLDRV